MKGPALKQLLLALSETKDSASLSASSSAELKPQQMVTILQRLFGDSVHVINPALSVQASPLAKGPAQATGSLQYLQALRPLTPLKKPVVMLVAQPQTEQKSRSSPVTVNAWRTMVIVPQNYQPPEGKPVGNDQNPLIYYFDPQKQVAPNQAPPEIMSFCQVLIRGCQVPAMRNRLPVRIAVEPVFKQLGFLHGCRDICHEPADSSWWALYFAIMAISYGGVSFTQTDRLTLFRLQTVLESALIEPAQSLETSLSTSTASSGAMTTFSSSNNSSTDIKTIVQSSSSSSTSSSLESPKPTADPAEASWLMEALKTLDEKPSKPAQVLTWHTGTEESADGATGQWDIKHWLPSSEGKAETYSHEFELVSRKENVFNGDFFVQNTLKYWHEQQGKVEKRAVLYLFSGVEQAQSRGLIIRWLNPNLTLAEDLWNQHRLSDQQPKTQRYLKNKPLMAGIRNLFTEIEMVVFTGVISNLPTTPRIRIELPEGGQFKKIPADLLYALPTVKPKKRISSSQKEAKEIDENDEKKETVLSPISPSTLSETSVPSVLNTDIQSSSQVPRSSREMTAGSREPESKYSGPVYTPAMMAGILRAYQIASTPEDKLSRDSSSAFELTAYPQATVTETVFLQALLHYWQARQGLIDNWRAAFLFSTQNTQTGQSQTVAVMIQYAVPNTALASQLWQEQKVVQMSPTPELLNALRLTLTQAAPKLYGKVQVMVLGVAAQSSIVNALKGPLEKVCRGQVALNFKAIPQTAAYSVILMEDVLGMLQHAQTHQIEPNTVAKSHQERCVQAILDRWRQTEHHNAPLHQELLAVLRTVLIMSTLQIQRRSDYQQPGEDKPSPRMIQARDQAMKKHLYAQRFPYPQALIEGLPLAVLASFLVTTEVTENLKTLNQHRDQLRLEILRWELTLQDHIRRQRFTPCDYVTQTWSFVYYSSFLGLGGELFRLLGRSLSDEGSREEKDHKTEQDLGAQEARLVGRMVQAITRSESLSTRSETVVRLYLGTEPVSRSLGILGTCLGAGVQIYLGPYALLQMLGMSVITLTGYRKVEADRLDDFKAELKEPLCSLTALHRLSVLLWHGGEALTQGSLVPIILAAGGMMGSESLTFITRRVLPQENKEAKFQKKRTTAEGPELSTLLIRQVGTLLGQRGAAMVWITAVGIQHRILYRDTAVALLSHGASNHPGLSEWKIEGADFRRPSLWLNEHNPLMLSWITPSGAQRQALCEIKGLPVLTPAGITGLVCTGDLPATEISTTLGLPKP